MTRTWSAEDHYVGKDHYVGEESDGTMEQQTRGLLSAVGRKRERDH